MFETTIRNLRDDIKALERDVEAADQKRKDLRRQLRQANAVLKKLEDQTPLKPVSGPTKTLPNTAES